MGKYPKKYKYRQKGAKNKRKSPSELPTILKAVPMLLFLAIVGVRFPNITSNGLVVTAIAMMLLYAVMVVAWKIYYLHRLQGATIRQIDKMSGEEFEDWLALMYKKHGYDVKMTPKTCDFGADLILTNRKTGEKICVQAKRYRNAVGEEAVQQTLSGKNYYDCDKAIIITNSQYTDAAKKLAQKCDIKMIDRFKLGSKAMYEF